MFVNLGTAFCQVKSSYMLILIPPSLQKLKFMFYRLAYLGQSQKKKKETREKKLTVHSESPQTWFCSL